MQFLQGEIYRYRPNENLGKEREGEYNHRVLIVSDEKFNRGGHVLTAFFTTKKLHLIGQKNIVAFVEPDEISAAFGLSEPCVLQADSLVRTPERYLDERLGRISDKKLEEVIAAVGSVMDASCFRT
jgi:mRNA-degrading endonuclease toxin of MazEF toxin-antitoxin module